MAETTAKNRQQTIATPYGELTATLDADGRVSAGYGGMHGGSEGVKAHIVINRIPYELRMSLKPSMPRLIDWGARAGQMTDPFQVEHVHMERIGEDGRTHYGAVVTDKARSLVYGEIARLVWAAFEGKTDLLHEAREGAWKARWNRLVAEARSLREQAAKLDAVADEIMARDHREPCPHPASAYYDGNRRHECRLCGRAWNDIPNEEKAGQ